MKPNNVTIKFEGITQENKARLIGVQPLFEFENNVRTDKQIGFSYEILAEKNNFEKFSVKVTDLVPVITNELIAEANEPVYVTFSSDFVGKFYWSNRTSQFEISCKASKAILVKPQPK